MCHISIRHESLKVFYLAILKDKKLIQELCLFHLSKSGKWNSPNKRGSHFLHNFLSGCKTSYISEEFLCWNRDKEISFSPKVFSVQYFAWKQNWALIGSSGYFPLLYHLLFANQNWQQEWDYDQRDPTMAQNTLSIKYATWLSVLWWNKAFLKQVIIE